ncbi:unnamed protein product [Mytilus edulis]|uniref:Centrosomal protein of 162 kDa n=1 Tax=Mytilus edulis TaxID=6550 RepID=A0A8S3U0H0_MYTED|nr:unnamed protein product [Mytilus edulis]
MLRSVEQKNHTVKLQYKDRIKDLEAQLHLYKRPDDNSLQEYDHPHTCTLALQRELDSVRERYQKQVTELQAEINNLNIELNKTQTSQAEEEENYIRLALLLKGVSPKAVRTFFDKELPPTYLPSTLNKNYNTLYDLYLKRILNQTQWNLLLPKNGMYFICLHYCSS